MESHISPELLSSILAIEGEEDLTVDEIFEYNVHPEKRTLFSRDYIYTKKEVVRRLLAICHRMYRDEFHREDIGGCWVKLTSTRSHIDNSLIAKGDEDRELFESIIQELHDIIDVLMTHRGKKKYFSRLQYLLEKDILILLTILKRTD